MERREAPAQERGLRRGQLRLGRRRAPAHAGAHVHRRRRPRHEELSALPRVRVHGQRLRERGLPRLCCRRSRLRPTDELDLALSGVLPSAKTETAKTLSAEGTTVNTNENIGATGGAHVDLPDVDARTTRYFWTVVPVAISVSDSGTFEYDDVETPQDACEAGRVSTFAKLSRPAITASGTPYVSGLTPNGRLLSVAGPRPVVYSTPLVAWRPVIAASAYRVEWSKSKYPWRRAGTLVTRSTSAVLNLRPGNWFYRVRGLNPAQVGTSAMTWSSPVGLTVSRPTFRVSR
ncbi:MAG: hypothetical protein E6G11_04730 [Actinobacteria bacterium]|nr:MAG: hypothetical protein E6G11_04730 [Actinomycetota bacterium]